MAVLTATLQKCSSLNVGCPWKIGSCESGHETCSQTPTYDTLALAGKQATAGMLATTKIPASTGTPALTKHQQAQAQPQQQKQQDMCGKAIIAFQHQQERQL
jgi:hypothetical protein